MSRLIYVFIVLFFITSCTTSSRRTSRPTPTYENIPSAQIAVPKSSTVIPGTNKKGDTELQEARNLLLNNKLDLAEKKFNAIISNYHSTDYATQAEIGLKETEVKKHLIYANYNKAIQLICEYSLQNYYPLAKDYILNRLDTKQLKELLDTDSTRIFHDVIYFRLGESYLQNNELYTAKSYFEDLFKDFPASPYTPTAKNYIQQIETYSKVSAQTIGVILPLSGKLSTIGQKTLRAISLGFGLHSSVPSKFKIAVIDSEGKPDLARLAVDRLVKEDNVVAIIGTVSSKTAIAAAERANELGVPSIALSQRSGVTEVGPYVYRNALTSETQVQYLVKTAMEKMGLKKFAILYPNDSYGVEFANLFWDEVLSRGGQVTGAQVYSTKETDFRDPIKRLVGTYYYDSRQEELNYYLDLKKKNSKSAARAEEKDEVLPPIIDFDAVFIPDSPKSVGQIAHMLLYNNVRGVKLLGTNIWNHSSLPKRLADYDAPILFVDSYNFSDLTNTQNQFIQEYRNIYSEDPGLVEIQAYDTAQLLQKTISVGDLSTREELNRALERSSQKTPNREFYRPLRAFTLSQQAIVPMNE